MPAPFNFILLIMDPFRPPRVLGQPWILVKVPPIPSPSISVHSFSLYSSRTASQIFDASSQKKIVVNLDKIFGTGLVFSMANMRDSNPR
jgi:hypothetical protein